MLDYQEFVSRSKSLLVAPAGYGKTYTIAKSLTYCDGKQLILTHTHAGVASLREKIKKEGVPHDRYHVETITSYALKYVNAFYTGSDLPEKDSANFWKIIVEKATDIVKIKPVSDVIKISYKGLFVDEYQDCSKTQHTFIESLSSVLPTRILGDPLQGIFDFNDEDPIVDWECVEGFCDNKYCLDEPWRWKNTNQSLGDCLREIRDSLSNNQPIDLSRYNGAIEVVQTQDTDVYLPNKEYNIKIQHLLSNEENLLLIHPDTKNVASRMAIIKCFNNRLALVEAIDQEDFYKISKVMDAITPEDIYKKLYEKVLRKIFCKTDVGKWFNDNSIKNKRDSNDKKKIDSIKQDLQQLELCISFKLISRVLKQVVSGIKVKCYRKELLFDLCRALEQAEYNDASVYDSMVKIRNQKRARGKNIQRKCIGTTLLTKGLEFDTVAILGAHKIEKTKDLYVALTRASKRLIVFSNTLNLTTSI